ncbi:MAG: MBL fold metallo-hydrolase [Erysipelotrichaceae bacterium]|nr:MBL fold metallo-hydrolase [Erysipelotrichaceae bacterium]
MKLIMLGTGNAVVTRIYNTCFVLEEDGKCMLVDGGGGNGILTQLQRAHLSCQNIHTIFVTHKHIDHLLGIIWIIRLITSGMSRGNYVGDVVIYAHDEVIEILLQLCKGTLQENQLEWIGKRLHFVEVKDGECYELMGHKTTFFDIHSTKAKQFGFSMMLNDTDKLTCCGDEPYHECEEEYVKGSKWLLHEAFCLYSEREVFNPYKINHSTVKDACELAEKMKIDNLILYHTEEKNIEHRKSLYTKEGRMSYSGNLFVPDDLEVFEL